MEGKDRIRHHAVGYALIKLVFEAIQGRYRAMRRATTPSGIDGYVRQVTSNPRAQTSYKMESSIGHDTLPLM